MKKKLFIFTMLFFLITSVTVSGTSFLKKKHNAFYKRHFAMVDFVFRDSNVLKNFREYRQKKAHREREREEYFRNSIEKNTRKPLKTITYDGSGQAVHPDILFSKEGVFGYNYWLAFTPYPHAEEKMENPSILVSNNGLDFKEPPGIKNPIINPPEDVNEGGHLSDTDIVLSNGNLEVYYVYNKRGVRGPSKFYKTTSNNGINWSKPELVYESVETVEGYSPAVIKENSHMKMWFVGGEGNFVYTDSKDDGKNWSSVTKCELNIGKWIPWHVDIIKTDKGYEGLMSARDSELNTRALFYMYSNDGVKWSSSEKPLVFPSKRGWDNGEIYRSTFIKDEGKYKIWYSARNNSDKWGIGYFEVSDDEMQKFIK